MKFFLILIRNSLIKFQGKLLIRYIYFSKIITDVLCIILNINYRSLYSENSIEKISI